MNEVWPQTVYKAFVLLHQKTKTNVNLVSLHSAVCNAMIMHCAPPPHSTWYLCKYLPHPFLALNYIFLLKLELKALIQSCQLKGSFVACCIVLLLFSLLRKGIRQTVKKFGIRKSLSSTIDAGWCHSIVPFVSFILVRQWWWWCWQSL